MALHAPADQSAEPETPLEREEAAARSAAARAHRYRANANLGHFGRLMSVSMPRESAPLPAKPLVVPRQSPGVHLYQRLAVFRI